MIQLKGAGSMENVMGIPGVLNRPNASLSLPNNFRRLQVDPHPRNHLLGSQHDNSNSNSLHVSI